MVACEGYSKQEDKLEDQDDINSICFIMFERWSKANRHRSASGQLSSGKHLTYHAFAKAIHSAHAVAKDSLKDTQTAHAVRKLAQARGSLQKLAKSVPPAKACESVFAQNAARESQKASGASNAKGACERRAH